MTDNFKLITKPTKPLEGHKEDQIDKKYSSSNPG